jgi:hypothetical protein
MARQNTATEIPIVDVSCGRWVRESCLRVSDECRGRGVAQQEGADGDLERLEGLRGELCLEVRRLRGVHRQRAAPPGGCARLLRRHGHVVAGLQVGPQIPHGLSEVPPRHLLRRRGGGGGGARGSHAASVGTRR